MADADKVARVERWVMWGGTVLLVPIVMWALSLQRGMDVMKIQLDQAHSDIVGLQARVSSTENAVNGIGSINTKLDNLTQAVSDLKGNLDYIFRRELEKRP